MGVVIWGATGQARVLWELLLSNPVRILALIDDNPGVVPWIEDVPVLHGMTGLEEWMRAEATQDVQLTGLVAVGDGRIRRELQDRLTGLGIQPYTAIHRTAWLAETAVVGGGSQILANASVGVDAVVGRACIVNTAAGVDHHCRLGDGVHIGPGACLAGHVDVEDDATVSTGAVVIPHVCVGRGALVGAGSVVIRDVLPYTVVAGNPARMIRSIERPSEDPGGLSSDNPGRG